MPEPTDWDVSDRGGVTAKRGIRAADVETRGSTNPPVVVAFVDDDGSVRLRLVLDRVDADMWREIEEGDPNTPDDVKAHRLLWALVDGWLWRRLDDRLGDPPPVDESEDKVVIRIKVGDGPLEPVMDLDKAAVAASGLDPQRVLANALRDLADELDNQSSDEMRWAPADSDAVPFGGDEPTGLHRLTCNGCAGAGQQHGLNCGDCGGRGYVLAERPSTSEEDTDAADHQP